MSRKYSLEEVKEYFNSFGYLLLSKKYNNNKEKLSVICPNNHKWEVTFFDFKVRNVRCPFCRGNYNNEKIKFEKISAILREKGFKIIKFKNTSDITIKCLRCDNEFKIIWRKFKKHLSCPFCSGRRKTYLIIKKYVEENGYKLLSNNYRYNEKLKLKCPNNHIFEIKWNDFQQGHRCPICYKKYNYTYDEVKNIIEKENYIMITTKENFKNTCFIVKCLNCGNEFQTNIYRWLNGLRCFNCWKNNKISKIEKDLHTFLKENNINYVIHDREMLNGKEIDIYIPDYKLGLEICGLFWHSEKFKNKLYHYEKFKIANEEGIILFQIFEDEYYKYGETIKSKILLRCNKLEKFKKYRANKLNIITNGVNKNIITSFLDNYHLQGSIKNFSYYIVLTEKNEIKEYDDILGLITISKYRFLKEKENIFEISRICFKPFTLIYGGSEKLIKETIKMLKKEYKNFKLISFVDLRYFSGKINNNFYMRLGFKLEKISKPNYYYFNVNNTSIKYHRYTMKKRKGEDKNIPEYLLREKEGFLRIFDAGHLKFSLEIKK